MADYINMQQTEYDELQVKLNSIHESILVGESEIREAIQELVKIQGGFYVQKITLKVNSMLFQMGMIVATDTATLFYDSEVKIASHIQSVIQTDIVKR